MVYEVPDTTASRCTAERNGLHCVLGQYHINDHVSSDGRRRWPQRETWQYVNVTLDEQQIGKTTLAIVAENAMSQAMRACNRLDHVDDRLDGLNERLKRVEEHTAFLDRAKSNAFPADLVTGQDLHYMRQHMDAMKLELETRIHTLTHRVIALERKPGEWDATSAEPDHALTYVDCEDSRWQWVDNSNGAGWAYDVVDQDDVGPFYSWPELRDRFQHVAAFPWRVVS